MPNGETALINEYSRLCLALDGSGGFELAKCNDSDDVAFSLETIPNAGGRVFIENDGTCVRNYTSGLETSACFYTATRAWELL